MSAVPPPWPVAADDDHLRRRWANLCERLGGRPPAIESAWYTLHRAYRDPARHYHTLEHVGEVLAWVDHLTEGTNPSPALELAAWLHDLVYDVTRSDNEQSSARWASEHLPHLNAAADIALTTGDLIMMTIDHLADPADAAATVLADADLAILGAPPPRYERYAADVRREYGSVTDAAWSIGRTRVLSELLARPRLYHAAVLEPLATQARRNMESEVAGLR